MEKVTGVLPYCGLLSALITEEKAPFQLEVSGNKMPLLIFLPDFMKELVQACTYRGPEGCGVLPRLCEECTEHLGLEHRSADPCCHVPFWGFLPFRGASAGSAGLCLVYTNAMEPDAPHTMTDIQEASLYVG